MTNIQIDATVRLDTRERALITLFNGRDSDHRVELLPVGDVVCEYICSGTSWIAERKTASDFVASICDGRFKEQRSRCKLVVVRFS